MGFNVEGFLNSLSSSVPRSNKSQQAQSKKLEKVFLNFPGNFGRYQIFPFSGQIDPTGSVFNNLSYTREISVPYKVVGENGEETTKDVWVKLLPKSAYRMKDASGRIVSSLTAEDESLLDQAYQVWGQLFEKLDAKNNYSACKDIIRRKDYVIFYGYCLNQWDLDRGARDSKRQNFGALFVATTKKILQRVEEDIIERSSTDFNGETDWVSNIYESKAKDRSGALTFTIYMPKSGPAGFEVKATHQTSDQFRTLEVPGDVLAEFTDPVETFLGWQANRQDDVPVGQRRLFNAKLIKMAINHMIQLLSSNGLEVSGQATLATNQTAQNSLPQPQQAGYVPDPMFAQEARQQQQANQEVMGRVQQNNTNPYQTPPAAHFDPVTSAPVQPEAPFQQAQFVSGFATQDNSNGDLPF